MQYLIRSLKLTELGFQAYAMDLINFPEGMEVYLTMEIRLHRLVSSGIKASNAFNNAGHSRPSTLKDGLTRIVQWTWLLDLPLMGSTWVPIS